jgi:hypothetical protein
VSAAPLPRTRHVFFVLVCALAGALAVSVSPADARPSASLGAFCGAAGTSQFSSLARLGVGSVSTARGGTEREPSSTETAIEAPPGVKGRKNFRATIPVYFHVVHDGALANLTQKQIDDQIRVMNMGFSGLEGGIDTGFRFELAGVTRTDNPLWLHHGYGDKYEREMKRALHQGGREALNIYATDADVYLGWAYFPNLSDSRLYLDGLVVDWESMPGTSTRYAGVYDLGKTATHEAGHWLNLYHVFDGGCNNYGDHVDDTPPQLIASRGCPVGQDSCKEPGVDSIHNYMDYSADACYEEFTPDQADRMQAAWLAFRAP